MFCQNCGKEILDDSKFCIECGAPLAEVEGFVEEQGPTDDFVSVDPDIDVNDYDGSGESEVPAQKKKKTAIIWIAVAAVLLLLATLIFILGRPTVEATNNKGNDQKEVSSDQMVQEDADVLSEDPSELSEIIINTNEPVQEESQQNVPEESLEELPEIESNWEEEPVQEELWQQDYYPVQEPFYGIWCSSSKDEAEMMAYAEDLMRNGFDAQVVSTDYWSNLNDGWYSVTAGMYMTEEDAEYDLEYVQSFYSDAYVKFSGEYQGN